MTILALATILLAGCAANHPTPGTPVVITRYTVPYQMAPLDSAVITLKNEEKVTLFVEQDGFAALPNGRRRIAGMSAKDFSALLHSQYSGQRTVEIIEFHPNRVSVLGEVFHQIHTDIGGTPMRVMDGIAAANGFTPLANRRRVRLLRENAGTVTVYELDLREMMQGYDLNDNLLLQPGDVITVPRNFL